MNIEQGAFLTPDEVARMAGISIDEVWRQLETGALPAVALAEWLDGDGNSQAFDYTLISPEVVRRMIAGTHEVIES